MVNLVVMEETKSLGTTCVIQEKLKVLTELHEDEVVRLHSIINKLRKESEELRREKESLEGQVKELRGEVEGIRTNFDQIQGRLSKIIVEEDDLVKLLSEIVVNEEDEKIQSEEQDKEGEFDDSEVMMTTTLKYLKKLRDSDPLNLCRLLEISFSPSDRAFALSSSLLKSISAHLKEDPSTWKIFKNNQVATLLIDEIINLRLEINDICKCFLKNSKKSLKTSKDQEEFRGNIINWLIEGHEEASRGKAKEENEVNLNPTGLISSFLSNFK